MHLGILKVAAALKALVSKLTVAAKKWDGMANDLRRAQGIR
jgi:hypothetical protein